MGKIVLFILILAGIMIYPVIELNNYKPQKEVKNVSFIPTVLKNGKYFIYKGVLEKEGSFEELKVFSKKRLEAYDFTLKNVLKQTVLTSERVDYKDPLLRGKTVNYMTKDYNLSTDFAVYNNKTEILNGGKFKVFGNSFRGFGQKFKVDKNDNVYADNIKYFLKVK